MAERECFQDLKWNLSFPVFIGVFGLSDSVTLWGQGCYSVVDL